MNGQLVVVGRPGEYYDSFDKIEARLLEIAKPGDLIITMGAGNVNTVGPAICTEK